MEKMTKLSVVIVWSPEIMKYVAFICVSQEITKLDALDSAIELITSLNAFALRLFSIVNLEIEPKF